MSRRVIAASLAGVMGLGIIAGAILPFVTGDDDGATGATVTRPTTASHLALPDVTVSDLTGTAVPLRSITGPLVINYWFSNCPPCKEEMPALAGVAAEYAGQVTFVGINPQDDADVAARTAAERGVTYRQLLDKTNRSVDALRLTGFPTTVFVDADGTIVETVRHAVTAAEVRAIIEQELLP